MNKLLQDQKQIRNYTRLIDMTDYTVETDLFPREALVVYSAYNMEEDVAPEDRKRYFSAHRGGSQGDYREGMRRKIANVVDCLSQFPRSKRAVITIPNTSFPSHTNDDDAKCCREIHFYLDDDKSDNLCATVWMRAQAAEIFPKNVHFVGSIMEHVATKLHKPVGTLFYLATTLVSVRND